MDLYKFQILDYAPPSLEDAFALFVAVQVKTILF